MYAESPEVRTTNPDPFETEGGIVGGDPGDET
jgi:hypothetical protein